MPTHLLTRVYRDVERWIASEINPKYTQELTTQATVAKNVAGTYFKYRPGITVTAAGNFPSIALAKSGWIIGKAIVSNLGAMSGFALHSGQSRVAQKIVLNDKISSVGYSLEKYGAPTGTAYVMIRKVSDDSVIATSSTTLDVSTVPTSPYTNYIFLFANVDVNEEVYLSIEYTGGNSSNCLYVGYGGMISGNAACYTTSWIQKTYDLTISVCSSIPQTGSFASGNWTFKVALYNQTKYGHAVKIAARLSRSTQPTGANATLIGAVTESPNTITLAGTAGDIKTDTWTYNPGAVTLTNEYLFVEFRCVIVTPATSSSAQHSFICDEDPATRDESVTPTTFTPAGGVTPGWNKLQYLTEPPTAGAFNKIAYESEPPVPAAWNKIKYTP